MGQLESGDASANDSIRGCCHDADVKDNVTLTCPRSALANRTQSTHNLLLGTARLLLQISAGSTSQIGGSRER